MSGLRCNAAFAALLLLSTMTIALAQSPPSRLSMMVTGLRNNDGALRCALFNSPATFPKIGQEWRGVVAPIRNQQATCVFSGIPAGTYAVAFFHAEHNETQLTTGAFGKPLQVERQTRIPLCRPGHHQQYYRRPRCAVVDRQRPCANERGARGRQLSLLVG